MPLASLADETPEGRSIVVLAKEKYGLRGRTVGDGNEMQFIPFTSQTRMSGVDYGDIRIRKGAADAMYQYIETSGEIVSENLKTVVEMISRAGGTPLVVAKNGKALGVIHLKDIVKGGIKERFAQLRKMGIKTVMITGDNRLTAATIAAEAGVDDFLAEATPESKLKLIRDKPTLDATAVKIAAEKAGVSKRYVQMAVKEAKENTSEPVAQGAVGERGAQGHRTTERHARRRAGERQRRAEVHENCG